MQLKAPTAIGEFENRRNAVIADIAGIGETNLLTGKKPVCIIDDAGIPDLTAIPAITCDSGDSYDGDTLSDSNPRLGDHGETFNPSGSSGSSVLGATACSAGPRADA